MCLCVCVCARLCVSEDTNGGGAAYREQELDDGDYRNNADLVK